MIILLMRMVVPEAENISDGRIGDPVGDEAVFRVMIMIKTVRLRECIDSNIQQKYKQ